ncbi:unnamed protein product [Echinostoma caproni]|uniref:Reverse transcriptase domain-containing protein n=1 Tax=Echinostoma caproni TaxID=27848 RepID=A0A183AYA9_9TREM|nr:unnamed protein product [Echinostoma caproni]
MDTMLTGITGTAAYLNDTIVMGHTQELFSRLNGKRIQYYGFRIREDKCDLFMATIKYFGFLFDKDGRRPDPENSKSIQNMPPPKDLVTLRSFLGLVSHCNAFFLDMHRAMDQLVAKDQPWN